MFLHMIQDVITHLGNFFVFLIFVILLFTTSFTVLMMDNDFYDQQNFINYIFIIYQYIFQQFPAPLMPQYATPVQPVNFTQAQPLTFPFKDENSYYLLACHLCAQLIISLILMNLIIGLINDALNMSLTNKESAQYEVTNNMIMYCERFLPSFIKEENYLHIISYEKKIDEESDNQWKERISDTLKDIEQKINGEGDKKLKETVAATLKKTQKIKETVAATLKETQKIKEMLLNLTQVAEKK